MEKGKFIYWRWKDQKTWNQSYVQELVETDKGTLIHFSDSSWWTAYPNRVLKNDIDILNDKPTQP